MGTRITFMILILGMALSIAAMNHPNFTAACEEVRLQMIANDPSLEDEPQLKCGAEYSPKELPALSIMVDLEVCLHKWPGWQISRSDAFSQWLGPLVGFLLPAMIFVICIPRDPRFLLPRVERFFNKSIVFSILWLAVVFLGVVIEVVVWIITVFSLAGPMMAGAMDEGIKDWRILKKVESDTQKNEAANGENNDASPTAKPTFFSRPQKLYTLALVMVGTFKPLNPSGPSGVSQPLVERVIRLICDADLEDAKSKLHQLLNAQGPFGIQVGAPVVFYIGAYAFALFDAKSRLGDNDTAHAIAFGIWYGNLVLTATACCAILGLSRSAPLEAAFGGRVDRSERHAPYKAVWLWDRGFCVRSWVDGADVLRHFPQAPIHESIRHILKSRVNRFLAALLSFIAIASLCSFAIVISYFTPIIGFGCRATTVLCYGSCQVMLILCWLYYNEDRKRTAAKVLIYSFGTLCWAFSTFVSIGGTVMQLLGVYRNCICKAGLRYWLKPAGGIVGLAVDTQALRDSGEIWFRFGLTGLIFISGFCIFSWGYFMRMKAKLAEQIDALK